MKTKIVILLIFLCAAVLEAFADAYVPEFNKMQTLRCEVDETLYNLDGSVVNHSRYFRIFRIDDEYQKIYLQKEPVDKVLQYDMNMIKISLQSMTDESIVMSAITIDRQAGRYFSESQITYDNQAFGTRYAKAQGTCKIIY